MKKKILAAIAAGLICVSASGCGTTYQEAISANTANGATRSNSEVIYGNESDEDLEAMDNKRYVYPI